MQHSSATTGNVIPLVTNLTGGTGTGASTVSRACSPMAASSSRCLSMTTNFERSGGGMGVRPEHDADAEWSGRGSAFRDASEGWARCALCTMTSPTN